MFKTSEEKKKFQPNDRYGRLINPKSIPLKSNDPLVAVLFGDFFQKLTVVLFLVELKLRYLPILHCERNLLTTKDIVRHVHTNAKNTTSILLQSLHSIPNWM